MARPASDVAICNLALDLLKEKPISALTGDNLTDTEALCARWYDTLRQATLEAYNWNFALVSAEIPRGGAPDEDDSDYTDYYTFPNDFLKLRAILDPEVPLGRREFEIQGRNLFFNNGEEEALLVWYTADITNITKWPALFIELFALVLANKLGKRLTARPAILKDIKEDLIEARRLARAVDGQVRPPKRYESSKIVSAGLSPSSNRTVAGAYEFPDGMDD